MKQKIELLDEFSPLFQSVKSIDTHSYHYRLSKNKNKKLSDKTSISFSFIHTFDVILLSLCASPSDILSEWWSWSNQQREIIALDRKIQSTYRLACVNGLNPVGHVPGIGYSNTESCRVWVVSYWSKGFVLLTTHRVPAAAIDQNADVNLFIET